MDNNKINIETIKYLVPDYINGLLDSKDKQIVENAINKSDELKVFYKEMKMTFDFAGNVKYNEPSQQYWNNLLPRIHQRIEEKQEKKAARNPFALLWKILVPVAAIILIFIIYQLATSPGKQIVDKKTYMEEKKEVRNNNIDTQKTAQQTEEKKDNIIAPKNNIDNNPDNSGNNVIKTNNNYKNTSRAAKTDFENVNNEQNIADYNNNTNNDNVIKEALDTEDKEELASADIDESSITVTGQSAGYDEEIEKDLNKLNDNEQNNLLEQLSSSNL